MYVYIYINQKLSRNQKISTKSLTTSFFEDKYIISSKAKRSGREEKICVGETLNEFRKKLDQIFNFQCSFGLLVHWEFFHFYFIAFLYFF